jgi:hypothetical protein
MPGCAGSAITLLETAPKPWPRCERRTREALTRDLEGVALVDLLRAKAVPQGVPSITPKPRPGGARRPPRGRGGVARPELVAGPLRWTW